MSLFRRRKPLHQRLAEQGGLGESTGMRGLPAEAPGWTGEQRGEPGIHGIARPRRWDVVTAAETAALPADRMTVRFAALPDGSLVAEGDEPDAGLSALAEAVEERLPAPYRAEAVRRGETQWAVAATQIAVIRAPGLAGEEAELVVSRDGRSLRVDGMPEFGSAPALERVGEAEGGEYVVRARRLDGDLWEVEASPL